MPSPRVTVGFTTYNVERYLPLAFDAILAQDFTDFEVVVCDNGSSDRTWEICRRYADRDPRFRVHQNQTNIGESASLARVVELARGEFFRLTAHDDLCHPSLLRRCLDALDAAGPGTVLAYPQTMIIDEAGNQLGPWAERLELTAAGAWRRVARYAHRWSLCNQLFGVIRLDQLRRTGLQRPYVGGDVTLLTELAALGRFVEVRERLFYRRMHTGSTLQSGRAAAEVLRHLEPTAAPVAGKRHPRSTRAHLTVQTVRALSRCDLPLPTRYGCAAAYALSWSVRRARVRAGVARRRLLGRQLPRAPWEPGGGY